MANNLDDITRTSFCIPFKKRSSPTYSPFPSSSHPSRDLPSSVGNDLRLEAYRVAWAKCLLRMQEIITDLQKSTVHAVVNAVLDSGSTPMRRLPGLPYHEMPVVVVINPTFGPSLLRKIVAELETTQALDAMETDAEDAFLFTPPPSQSHCLTVQFRAVDFSNVMTAMKSIVSGFVEKGKYLQDGERRVSSLAGYDIKYLEAWYRSLTANVEGKELPSKLVVLLHDFEQFDPDVMQDVFYICCQASPTLPLTFLLSLSSPLPNFLNTLYPAKTLSLMRVRTINSLGGRKVLATVLRKTFFEVEFDPAIVIGPRVLEFVQEFFIRHVSSVDAIFTILQLAHLKHFSSEPVAFLVHSTPSVQVLMQAESANFTEALRTRLELGSSLKRVKTREPHSTATIIKAIDEARQRFYLRMRSMRLGFGIMLTIQKELRRLGYKGLEWTFEDDNEVGVDVMIDLLRGHLVRDMKQLGTIIRKLKLNELDGVLDRLIAYFFELPAHARAQAEEQDARTRLALLKASVAQNGEDRVKMAEELSEWFAEYIKDKFRPLEELELWEVWYTRNMPPPSELLNPSVRSSIVAGLMRPYDYSKESSASESLTPKRMSGPFGADKGTALWELPDISILFKRYLDSGRMINVFDWFESFKGVLESQKRYGVEGKVGDEKESRLRKKGKGKKSKGKGKEKEVIMEEEEEEEWKMEVQARFIRSLHELDYIGLLKHTGRKRDHVMRVLFDVGDDDDDEG